MVKIKRENSSISEDVEETELSHTAYGNVNVIGTTTLENYWQFLLKLNKPRPNDPEIPCLGIYPTEMHIYSPKTCIRMLIATFLIIIPNWKCPLTEK